MELRCALLFGRGGMSLSNHWPPGPTASLDHRLCAACWQKSTTVGWRGVARAFAIPGDTYCGNTCEVVGGINTLYRAWRLWVQPHTRILWPWRSSSGGMIHGRSKKQGVGPVVIALCRLAFVVCVCPQWKRHGAIQNAHRRILLYSEITKSCDSTRELNTPNISPPI